MHLNRNGNVSVTCRTFLNVSALTRHVVLDLLRPANAKLHGSIRSLARRRFSLAGPSAWNALPDDMTQRSWQENFLSKRNFKVKLETKASSHKGQCIPAGCRVTLPRRVLITMSIITMRSRPFPANSASDCLRFAKPWPQFSNLVAPSTDGSAKCLVRYKVHLLL